MKKILLAAMLLFTCQISFGQMTTRVVRDSLFIPWELVYGPDNNIWFTQKNGYICRLNPATRKIDTLYHESTTYVNGEGGMMGMAVHPSVMTTQPYVYVGFNYLQGSSSRIKIVRYNYANDTLQTPTIMIDNIVGGGIHNGCRLLIVGDKLFITTGDAGNQSLPQNIQSINGKVLRLNLDGTIPSDNPIPGNPAWSWGHRNAQGMVYANNMLYVSEHGPGNDDEVSIVRKGRNYGWPTVHGMCNTSTEIAFCNDSNVVEPLKAWTPTLAVCGMDYYNQAMFPALQNSLLMTTLKDSKLYQLKLNSAFDSIISATVVSGISFGRLRDICIAPDGKIYLSTSNSSASGSGSRTDKIIEIYDPALAVNNIQESSEITIYPNPAGDYTVIKLPVSLGTRSMPYIITDRQGKTVMEGSVTGNNATISTKQLASGVYNIKITGDEGKMYTGKIMKQ